MPDARPRRIILGVDPSLTATGFAALLDDGSRAPAAPAPGLGFAHTVRAPAKGTLYDRLNDFWSKLLAVLEEFEVYVGSLSAQAGESVPVDVVIEDATSLRSRGAGHAKVNALSAARLGAAVGVVMVTVAGTAHVRWPVTTYTVDEWVPKRRLGRGGWTAPVQHDRVVAFYRDYQPALAQASDDEVMAYALACFHRERTREAH